MVILISLSDGPLLAMLALKRQILTPVLDSSPGVIVADAIQFIVADFLFAFLWLKDTFELSLTQKFEFVN